jgi:1-acyl-sn-glycerol-3-phosphate acyltransferase
MLEANKSSWFEKIFRIYNRNLLKRYFHSLHVLGLNMLSNKLEDKPLIIFANHSSWWDGLVVFEVLSRYNFENYVMMEEKHLLKLPFFRKLGAFSVVRENPREAFKSINYISGLLSENPSRVLLIFPQGQILPNDFRPIKFYSGVSRIIQRTGKCQVVPFSIRYEFFEHFKPEIMVRIGKLENIAVDSNFDVKLQTQNFEVKMTRELEKLKKDILLGQTGNYLRII